MAHAHSARAMPERRVSLSTHLLLTYVPRCLRNAAHSLTCSSLTHYLLHTHPLDLLAHSLT